MTFNESKTLILENLRSDSSEAGTRTRRARNPFPGSSGISIDDSELQEEFTVNFEMVSGEVVSLGKKEDLGEKIRELVAESGARSVCFWDEEPVKSLVAGDSADPAKADIGITGADFAIAETGTLVLLSGPSKPRLTSLLPPVHVSILKRESIVLDIHRLVSMLGERCGDHEDLCSCVSFITGPSRTADIELNLTLGVHGPEREIVVIV